MSRSNPIPVIAPGYVYWPRAAVILVSASAAVAGLALGILIALPSPAQKPANNPDWTVAPCSLWADNAQPKLPPYTVDSECYYTADDGSVQLNFVKGN